MEQCPSGRFSTLNDVPFDLDPAYVIGVIVLFLFAVWKTDVWSFIKAAARVPFVIEGVAKEFGPNGGGLREAVNKTGADLQTVKASVETIAADITRMKSEGVEPMRALEGRVAKIESCHDEIVIRLERLEPAEP